VGARQLLPWVVVLFFLVGVPPGGASVTSTSPHPSSAEDFHGNLSIAGPGPGVSVPAGTTLSIVYELQDPTYSAVDQGIYVHIPISAAVFNTSTGTFRVLLFAKIVTFTSTAWSSATNTTFNSTLVNATSFPSSGPTSEHHAVLSSQQVALTSPLPDGSWTVWVRWHWALQPIVGQNVSGPWEPSANGTAVLPAESATLTQPVPLSVPPGYNFTMCLVGPIAGRTFSLRLFEQIPPLLIGEVNTTVPAGQLTSYCLGTEVPSWVPPQTLLIELWEAPNASANGSLPPAYLLFSYKIAVVLESPPPTTLFGLPKTEVEIGALLVLAAVVTLVGVAYAVRQRRGRPPPAVSPRTKTPLTGPSAARPVESNAPPNPARSAQPAPSDAPKRGD
jgi:hypothetical protein